jgi:hypothetical protein
VRADRAQAADRHVSTNSDPIGNANDGQGDPAAAATRSGMAAGAGGETDMAVNARAVTGGRGAACGRIMRFEQPTGIAVDARAVRDEFFWCYVDRLVAPSLETSSRLAFARAVAKAALPEAEYNATMLLAHQVSPKRKLVLINSFSADASWHQHNGSAIMPSVSEIVVTKRQDIASPKLFLD